MNCFNEININRNSQMYLDIENFEDYEFTNCITFEMAIRNNDVLSGIIELLIIKNIITDIEPTKIYFDNNIMDKIFKENKFETINDYLWFVHTTFLTNKYYIDLNIIDFFSKYPETIYLLLKNREHISDNIIKYEYQPDFINKLNMKKYYTSNLFSFSNVYSYDHKNFEDMYLNTKSEHFVIQKFSRPKLRRLKSHDTNVHIMDINLNLPLEEILDYIKKIHETYNKTKNKEFPYVSSSFEILNSINNHKLAPINSYLLWEKNSFYNYFKIPKINLEEFLNGYELTIINQDYKSKQKNFNRLSKQDWADCFFIYDFYTKNKNYSGNDKARILQEYFDYYYFVKVQSTSNKNILKKIKLENYFKYPHLYINKGLNYKSYYSISTIKSRYNLMKELIENTHYTSFISG